MITYFTNEIKAKYTFLLKTKSDIKKFIFHINIYKDINY